MTSKEALKRLKQETAPSTYMVDFDKDECIEVIRKDLDLLKKYKKTVKVLENRLIDFSNEITQLEIANKNNENLVKENVRLVNENLKLKNRLEELEEDIKTFNEITNNQNDCINYLDRRLEQLGEENQKLKAIISLLKLRLDIIGIEFEKDFYYIDTGYGTLYTINKQEYELLKEVLGNDK